MPCQRNTAFLFRHIMSERATTRSKIYLAGHNGLVGSAILRELVARGYQEIVCRAHSELDLTDAVATTEFFQTEKPDVVILAAAVVGGINANNLNPTKFIVDNMAIQANVITAAFESDVERLFFLGSSCIYPRECLQPIKEEYFLSGPLEMTNRSYAVAKIAGIETCWAFNRQHGTRYIALMPTNLYGPNDNYDLSAAHVLPALVKRFSDATQDCVSKVTLWGTGRPLREFLHSDDVAKACCLLLSLTDQDLEQVINNNRPPLLNIGSGEEISIARLANLIAEKVSYSGDIEWNTEMPDGTPRKLLDSSLMQSLGWRPGISLDHGLELVCREYQQSLDGVNNER
jgi:GDP-L-fucose synthase